MNKNYDEKILPHTSTNTNCSLCTDDYRFVENLVWPISREEITEFSNRLYPFVISLASNNSPLDRRTRAILRTVLYRFVVEVVTLFQADCLSQRLRTQGLSPIIPDSAIYWKNLFKEQSLPMRGLDSTLSVGLRGRPLWRRILRPVSMYSSPTGFHKKCFEKIDFANEVVCVSYTPLSEQHALHSRKRVLLVEPHEWYSRVSVGQASVVPRTNLEDHQSIVDGIFNICRVSGVKMSSISCNRILDWLGNVSHLIEAYQNKLRLYSSYLPKEIWIGTSGLIWTRMLANVVKEKGGRVVGHDHGWGCNYSLANEKAVFELLNVDEFVTFNENQRNLYKKIYQASWGSQPDCSVRIVNLKPPVASRKSTTNTLLPRTIMYVCSLFPADIAGPTPMLPGVVAIDMQARIFSRLASWGYKIMVKPHPGSPQQFPAWLASRYNVTILSKPFETVYQKADLLIFDYPFSTTWGYAVNTDHPIVYVDLGFAPLASDEEDFRNARVSTVRAHFDSSNRVRIEWHHFHEAIKAASKLKDKRYASLLT